MPDTAPHLPIPSLPNALAQCNLLGQRALDKEGQAGPRSGGHRVVEYLPEGGVAGRLGPQTDKLVLWEVKNKGGVNVN